ncbi:MAG: tetratricopeptide repeat protein [Acidobacteriaceae bacterium]|nr:tetratricopeptide repeat protein [Acidobacteriaceae bacterium]
MYRLAMAVVGASLLAGQTKQSPQDLLKEAVTLHQQGKLEEAIHDYDIFLDMYPDMAEVRSNLAAALVGVGRYDEAITEYQLALLKKQDPKVRLNLAIAYYKAAQYKDAERELRDIRNADPANVQAVMLLASTELELGDNKAVIDLLSPMRRADPHDLGVAYLLGTALARDGQTAQAQIVVQDIMGAGDSAEGRLLLGTTKFGAHDFSGALADIKKAIELNPNLPDVYTYYGMVLLVMGDVNGSKEAFQKELARNPNNFDANLRLGALLRVDQDYEHALPYIKRALALRPGDAAVLYQIASLDLAQGKQDQARGEFESIVKAEPNFVEAHVSLASIYYREKRKADGDREREIIRELNAKKQAQEPGARAAAEANEGNTQ